MRIGDYWTLRPLIKKLKEEPKTEASACMQNILKSFAFSELFLKKLPDERLEGFKKEYDTSFLTKVFRYFETPLFGEPIEFVEKEIKYLLEGRDAVRRYEAGEVVCGISGF
ncbi:hypothetical protein GOV13_03625 [Candidatus Pacearchaeota archaeon]|nr:hypothetical protein [Candidatus Pacearchaeota archaeon]